jgi:hypothetical protein
LWLVTHDRAGISYSGRSIARLKLLATSLRLDSRAPLGAGHFFAPDLLLAKFGFGGLNNKIFETRLQMHMKQE